MEMDVKEMEEIQVTIEEAKAAIADGDAAKRLVANSDFQRVIGTMYYEQESIRLVGILADPALSEKQVLNVHKMVAGVGHLRMFMQHIMQLGEQMSSELEENEKAIRDAEVN